MSNKLNVMKTSLTLATVMIAACPSPSRTITTKEALETANQNLRTILTGAAKSGSMIDDSQTLGTRMDSRELERNANDVAARFADAVFNQANVESAEATKIVLVLRPEQACKDGEHGEVDARCAEVLTAVPIRLAIESYVAGDMDVAVLVGEARSNPINVLLHQDEISATVDLAAMRAAIAELLAAMHESEDALPRTMQGLVKLALHENAANDFTALFAVAVPVSIHGSTRDGDYALELAQAYPAASVRFDGSSRTITAESAWNAIRLALPMKLDSGSHTIELALAGLTGKAVLTPAGESLRVTGAGFGSDAARVTIDKNPLFSFDLNPNDGRRVDFTLAQANDGIALAVSPKLDARADFAFANAPQELHVPAWMLDETLEAILAGNGAGDPTVLIGDAFVKVLSGELTLSSRAMNKTVSVSEGMCLVEGLEAAACPQ